VPCQRLAGETYQPGIDHRIRLIPRDRGLQQSGSAKLANQRTARIVHVMAVRTVEVGRERVEGFREISMAGLEEGPREVFACRPVR
jgi:hypothetical protein